MVKEEFGFQAGILQNPSPEPSFQPVFLSSLGVAALQSAWVEPDAGVRTSMWDGLLALITKYPEVWSTRALASHGQDDDETSDSEVEGEDLAPTPTPTDTQNVLPGQSAYLDFLNFLQLGCLGSGVQSYPAIVIVLSTLPSTILPYNEDNLERFFDSFWAAVDSNALSVLPRDRESVLKSYLSSFLECVVFVCQRLKQTLESDADATTPGLLEIIMNTRIGQVVKELVQGGIMESLPANTAGTLLGGSIKKLEQIAPEIIDRAWMSTWKFALLDAQDQTPQLRNSARLLTSMLGPLEESALSTSNVHQLILEMVHLDHTRATDPGIATRQGQVLGILWEHKTFSDTTWLAEVTRNALRGGLMQHLISANNSRDIGTLLTGLLAVPSISVELGMDIWNDFLRLSVQESAYRLLRDVLGLVQFSPLQPVQQPELYQACATWVGEIIEGNSEHLPELSSVLSRWEMCLSRSQLHELLAPLVDSFIQEAEELVFSTDYSQSRPSLEGSTRILLSVIHHLEAQTLKDNGGFDLASLGALLHISPTLSLHLPPELGGLLSQLELGRKNVSGVLDLASQSGLYASEKDLLAKALPPQGVYNTELEDLADNPSSLLAEIDPLVPPIDHDPSGSGLLNFDSQGFVKYPRIARALVVVLSHNRHLAKEELWTFRHLLAFQQLCLDFVSTPFWPSDAFKSDSIESVQLALEQVSQLVIYIANSLFGDLGVDWHRQLVSRLVKPLGASDRPQNASDVILQLFSLASRTSAPLRDLRLLRRVMQMALRDADSDILDVWAGFAPGIQNQYPLPAQAIGSVLSSRGVESPRLDRWRNEVASRLTGVTPSSANAIGIPLLILLNSLAPPTESGIVFLPQQRAVYLIQALQKWMTSDEELDESLEAHVTTTLYHLLPIIQTVPGAHWEFTFDLLETNFGVDGETTSTLYQLLQTLRAVYSIHELALTNKALREDWKLRREGVYASILALFLVATENNQQSETRDKYNSWLVDSLRALASGKIKADLFDQLLLLVASEDVQIKAMAHELALNAVSQITEKRVIEAAMTTSNETDEDQPPVDEQQYELPQSLIDRLAPIPPHDQNIELRLNLLLSWWIAVEFFDNSSLKVKQGYLEQLRRLELVKLSLLPCLFELLTIGVVGAKPFGLSQWYVEEYLVDFYDSSLPSTPNVLAAHVYYKALKSIPGLIRSWWSDCQDKQLSSALSTYTKTYFSPILIKQELTQFRTSAASASEALNDDAFSVKVASNVNEISAVYTVDDQAIEVAIRLPAEFPLKAAEVRDVRGISGMENRRRAWVFGVQQTAQQGLIYDALSVFKKNVAGHFEGKSECAICYSWVS
ncbi:hypothetical protein FRC12_023113 [Ceratobasidium sp. 428]|nr:hypothetical protein FRC12_023113 [Ceratobasidium sp. 428]